MRLSLRSFLDCELPEWFPRYPKHSGPFQILSSLTSLPIRGSGWSNQVCLRPRLREDAGRKEKASRGTSRSTPGDFFEGRTLCARVARPNGCRGPSLLGGASGKLVARRGDGPVKGQLPFAGGRSPPSRGASLAKRPRGVNQGTTRRVVFSEGRTLCVRMARLNECRGIPFPPDDEARGLWPTGNMSGPGRCLPCGRAEPAPPRGDHPS